METKRDSENKTRTDYEITILEGQKMSDVFHEVGVPVKTYGTRNVHIEILSDDVVTTDEQETIERFVTEELYDWGYLCNDTMHNITSSIHTSESHSLKIYTD